jgi:4-hydroxy-tetrahydrodipicolinate synthase
MAGLPSPFGGIVPPVCTPLTEDQEVDTASLARLLTFLLEGGVHGVFVLGSTSESVYLTPRQRATVCEVAVHTVGGQVPVLAGVIDLSTAPSLEHARAARRAGVDALVLTAPFYFGVNRDEIIRHYRTVHDQIGLPIFAYDLPSAVHVKLERSVILDLARDGVLAGVKDSSGDDANFRGLVLDARERPGFATFTGSELVVDAVLLWGASGSVPGLGNVDPAGYVRIYAAARTGDWETARREQERLYQLFSIVYAGTPGRVGPTASALGGFKSALQLRGIIATNVVTPPLTRFNAEEVARVRAGLEQAGLL